MRNLIAKLAAFVIVLVVCVGLAIIFGFAASYMLLQYLGINLSPIVLTIMGLLIVLCLRINGERLNGKNSNG